MRGFGNKELFQEAKACTKGVRNECKKAKESREAALPTCLQTLASKCQVRERGAKRGRKL